MHFLKRSWFMGQRAVTHDLRHPSNNVTHLTHWPTTHRPAACSDTYIQAKHITLYNEVVVVMRPDSLLRLWRYTNLYLLTYWPQEHIRDTCNGWCLISKRLDWRRCIRCSSERAGCAIQTPRSGTSCLPYPRSSRTWADSSAAPDPSSLSSPAQHSAHQALLHASYHVSHLRKLC